MTRRFQIVFALSLGLLIVLAIVSVGSLFFIAGRTVQPTVIFEAPIEDRRLCPGEPLTVTNHIQVNRAPSLVLIYHSWWSKDLGYNVVLGNHVDSSVVRTLENFTRTVTVTIPSELTLGEYEYRRLAQEDGSPPVILSVPFEIAACP